MEYRTNLRKVLKKSSDRVVNDSQPEEHYSRRIQLPIWKIDAPLNRLGGIDERISDDAPLQWFQAAREVGNIRPTQAGDLQSDPLGRAPDNMRAIRVRELITPPVDRLVEVASDIPFDLDRIPGFFATLAHGRGGRLFVFLDAAAGQIPQDKDLAAEQQDFALISEYDCHRA
jgi:hypothetical protein